MRKSLKKRAVRWGANTVVCAMVASLSACSTDANENTNGDGGGRYGGTLIYVLNADPTVLNPAITSSAPDLYTACKIFEGLTRLDKELEAQPNLAASWDIAEDGKTYTFQLQENVDWHDGEPLTSADVKWSISEVSDEYGPRVATPFDNIASIETPDDNTVVMHLKESYGPFLKLLTCSNAAIIPEHIYGEGDVTSNPRNTKDPIGTGPFKFDEWKHGDHITLVKNENYWREKRPYLDSIILQVIPDTQAQVAALQSGEVDVLSDYILDKASFLQLKDTEGIEGETGTNVPTDNLLMFNTRSSPFDDRVFRQGVVRAINREAIIAKATFGLGEPGKSAINSELGSFHNPNVNYTEMYPYDPEAASAALDEAGITADASGHRMELTLAFEAGNPDFDATANIMRENLKAVGIDVTLEPLERTVMLEKVFTKHEFDLFLTRYTTSGDAALGVERVYLCSSIGTNTFNNASGYCNDEVDRLFAQASSATTVADRKVPYWAVQEILAEDVPTLVVEENASIGLYHDNVQNLWAGPDDYDYWEEVWVQK